MKPAVNIFWFRRDLRLDDNAGLFRALKENKPVVPLFIFDRHILDELEDKKDRRVVFIHHALTEMQDALLKENSTLDVHYGFPINVYLELMEKYDIEKVFTNNDYEPYARQRDAAIAELLEANGITFHSHKDHVIFEKNEVAKDDGKPYTVFTPYLRRWKTVLNDFHLKSYPTKKYFSNFYKQPVKEIPSPESMGFKATGQTFPAKKWKDGMIKDYTDQRDIPAVNGTSRLSVHLRFGTISIRELAREAGSLNESF